MGKDFHKELKALMDNYVHLVYSLSKNFPKEELYGVTSQLRQSSLSVILNYIEGFARNGEKTNIYFTKISYGSLQESKYLLHFSLIEKYLTLSDYNQTLKIADEIGGMLWGILKNEKK